MGFEREFGDVGFYNPVWTAYVEGRRRSASKRWALASINVHEALPISSAAAALGKQSSGDVGFQYDVGNVGLSKTAMKN